MNNNFRNFIKYASLSSLGMIGVSCYILADTFFISAGIGIKGLTALNIAIPVYSFINGTGLMLGMGGASKYSVLKSGDREKEANGVFTQTIFWTIVFSVLFFLTGLFFSEQITRLLKAGEEVFEMTHTYLKIMLLFSPAFILNNVILCFVRNDNAPGLSMAAMTAGSLFNIIFDYIFIFPLKMGILGAISATAFSPVISLIIMSSHKLRKKNGFHIKRTKLSIKSAAGIFKIGSPSLITELSSGTAIIIFNLIILNIEGDTGVAAYGIIANISIVITAVYSGIAQGIQPLISRGLGKKEKKTIFSTLKYAITTSLFISIAAYAVLFFFSGRITDIFNNENNSILRDLAENGIKIYFTGIIFAGINIVISTFFTAAEKPVPAYIITLSRGFFVIVPAAAVLSALFGMTGVWLAYPATEGIVFCAAAIMTFFSVRKNKIL